MLGLVAGEVFGAAGVGQGAAGGEVGAEYGLVGGEEFAGLGHEVYAAHDDDAGIGVGGFAGQGEGVADEVGYVLHVAYGIVVGEDDGVFLTGQAAYFLFEVDILGYGLIDVAAGFPFVVCHCK